MKTKGKEEGRSSLLTREDWKTLGRIQVEEGNEQKGKKANLLQTDGSEERKRTDRSRREQRKEWKETERRLRRSTDTKQGRELRGRRTERMGGTLPKTQVQRRMVNSVKMKRDRRRGGERNPYVDEEPGTEKEAKVYTRIQRKSGGGDLPTSIRSRTGQEGLDGVKRRRERRDGSGSRTGLARKRRGRKRETGERVWRSREGKESPRKRRDGRERTGGRGGKVKRGYQRRRRQERTGGRIRRRFPRVLYETKRKNLTRSEVERKGRGM